MNCFDDYDDDDEPEAPLTIEQFRQSFAVCKETLEELKVRRNNIKVHVEARLPEKVKVNVEESTSKLIFIFSTRVLSFVLLTVFLFAMLIYATRVKQRSL